jgi:hypothetical protein
MNGWVISGMGWRMYEWVNRSVCGWMNGWMLGRMNVEINA